MRLDRRAGAAEARPGFDLGRGKWRREARSGPDQQRLELRLAEMDVVTAIVRARIAASTALPEPIFEVPQVMHYAVGQEFRPHHDFLSQWIRDRMPGETG